MIAPFADQTPADRSVPARFSIRKNLQAGADVVSKNDPRPGSWTQGWGRSGYGG